nr:LysR substrate-binding domain-containing protein [Conyzicola lurida]
MSSAGIRGRLRVGIFSNLDVIDLPAVLGEFHAVHPLVDLQLGASAAGSTGFADDVRRGRLDVAFMGLPDRDLAGLEVLPLVTTPFVVVLPPGHPFASRPTLTMRVLAGERFVDTPAGFGNRIVIERAFAEAGITRTVSTQVSDLGEVPRFVAADLGIAVVPSLALPRAGAAGVDGGVVVVPLVDPDVDWQLSVVSRPTPSPAVSALLALFSRHLGAA